MKPQGSSINKPGSKYSPAPIIYNQALFKMGVTDLTHVVDYFILGHKKFTLFES